MSTVVATRKPGVIEYSVYVTRLTSGEYQLGLIAYPISPDATLPDEFYETSRCATFADAADQLQALDERMVNRRIEIQGRVKR